jgi:hypothetical protein
VTTDFIGSPVFLEFRRTDGRQSLSAGIVLDAVGFPAIQG